MNAMNTFICNFCRSGETNRQKSRTNTHENSITDNKLSYLLIGMKAIIV